MHIFRRQKSIGLSWTFSDLTIILDAWPLQETVVFVYSKMWRKNTFLETSNPWDSGLESALAETFPTRVKTVQHYRCVLSWCRSQADNPGFNTRIIFLRSTRAQRLYILFQLLPGLNAMQIFRSPTLKWAAVMLQMSVLQTGLSLISVWLLYAETLVSGLSWVQSAPEAVT